MQQILVTGEKVILRTGMTKDEFSRANIIQYINSKGYVIKKESKGDFCFREWAFDTVEERDSHIELSGESFFGIALYDILKETQSSITEPVCIKPNEVQKKHWKTLCAAIEAINAAIEHKIRLPNAGPLGIVCGDDDSFLFLPDAVLNRSLSIRSKETAAEFYYSWKQPLLSDDKAFSHTVSTYLYTVLTGREAFPAKSIDEIAEDYCDCNFVPVQYYAALKPELAEKINNCLDGKKKFLPSVARLLDFLSDDVDSLYIDIGTQNLAVVLEKFQKKQMVSIKRLRFFRKHVGVISIGSVLAVCVIAMAISISVSIKSKPATTGLTVFQTVESYYAGYTHLDGEIVDACITGPDTKTISKLVSQIYVLGKMKAAYGFGSGIFTPAQWLLMPDFEHENVYGLSCLKINGINADLSAEYIRETDRKILNEEPGKTDSVTVSFYLISNLNDEGFSVEKHNDILTLEFRKNRWFITHIDENITLVPVDFEEFVVSKKEGTTAVYEWLPSEKEIQNAEKELKKKFTLLDVAD